MSIVHYINNWILYSAFFTKFAHCVCELFKDIAHSVNEI